jgi:hypothetical protein
LFGKIRISIHGDARDMTRDVHVNCQPSYTNRYKDIRVKRGLLNLALGAAIGAELRLWHLAALSE